MGYLLDQSGNSLESLFLQFWTKKYPERLEPMTTNFLLTKYQPGCIVPGELVLYDTTDRIVGCERILLQKCSFLLYQSLDFPTDPLPHFHVKVRSLNCLFSLDFWICGFRPTPMTHLGF
jgi:hypothetical protein